MSDEEKGLLAAAARRQGLATGAFVAQAALAVASDAVHPEYFVLREALAEVMEAAGQVRRIGVSLNQAVAALNSGNLPARLQCYADAAARTVGKLDELADELCRRLP
ncbi:hypothetical protein [Actinomadura fibrosa]|uniref:Plasmid mobilization relaxosome protein MobC n=1 Tax=Actinomadura fibrosa TaxID=111802 RepID=A0ABW2XX60_9ACTN|nr:hypothetical protein [Actinomadura fibrosa]